MPMNQAGSKGPSLDTKKMSHSASIGSGAALKTKGFYQIEGTTDVYLTEDGKRIKIEDGNVV